MEIGGLPALILDSRIIEVLQKGVYEELIGLRQKSTFNKARYYVDYLAEMHRIAEANAYCVDQLELFLFQYGNNLKTTVASRSNSWDL